MNTNPKYILVTPAKNEEKYIELTIKSVINQTIKPMRWAIVSDGSTDRTDDIVKKYAHQIPFIVFVNAKAEAKRSFGSKVNAFNHGFNQINELDYDFIGNLDADVSFCADYFECLLKKFDHQPRLGLAGGIIEELINGRYVAQNISANSVAGAVQLFRRDCFDQIGGYIPISIGGIDAVAEIITRMKGWDVRTFAELRVLHHRRVANAGGDILKARFKQGRMYHLIGYHPLFQLLRFFNRLLDPPYIIGSVAVMAGFLFAALRNRAHALPPDVVAFLRNEQLMRIRTMLPF